MKQSMPRDKMRRLPFYAEASFDANRDETEGNIDERTEEQDDKAEVIIIHCA
jgi:hypothetical protein